MWSRRVPIFWFGFVVNTGEVAASVCAQCERSSREGETGAEEEEDAQLSESREQTGPGLRCTVEGGPRKACETVHL